MKPRDHTAEWMWLAVLFVCVLIYLTGCETIPPDELKFRYHATPNSLKNQCEIECFPKDVRWNYITHTCVCLKEDAR